MSILQIVSAIFRCGEYGGNKTGRILFFAKMGYAESTWLYARWHYPAQEKSLLQRETNNLVLFRATFKFNFSNELQDVVQHDNKSYIIIKKNFYLQKHFTFVTIARNIR